MDRTDGKSFRNEITPATLFFRIREFEQMELEFSVNLIRFWNGLLMEALLHQLAEVSWYERRRYRVRDHDSEELSFYSRQPQILSICSVWLGRALGMLTVPIMI